MCTVRAVCLPAAVTAFCACRLAACAVRLARAASLATRLAAEVPAARLLSLDDGGESGGDASGGSCLWLPFGDRGDRGERGGDANGGKCMLLLPLLTGVIQVKARVEEVTMLVGQNACDCCCLVKGVKEVVERSAGAVEYRCLSGLLLTFN